MLQDCWEYLKKSNGFGWTIDDAADQYGLKDLKFSPALAMSSVPPWILPVPEINIDLLEEKKDHPDQQSFAIVCKKYLSSSYHGYIQIYTDGSKDIQNGHCGSGIYIPEFDQTYGYRLSNFLSVYSVEMTGIITAFRWIEEVKPLKSVMY